MTHLDELAGACRALLDHRQAEPALLAAKDEALAALAAELGQASKVARAALRRLIEDGWSEEDIAGVGIGEGSVRAAVKKGQR